MEPTELVLYGAGLRSLQQLAEHSTGEQLAALETLNLHANRLSHIDADDLAPRVPRLRSLNLSSNALGSMAGVGAFAQLRALDLSSNRIRRIEGLAALAHLERLALAYNSISTLSGLVPAHGSPLRELDLRGNAVETAHELNFLDGLHALEARVHLPRARLPRALRPAAACAHSAQGSPRARPLSRPRSRAGALVRPARRAEQSDVSPAQLRAARPLAPPEAPSP
jgi:Leucine-rich repeat (LRR) protein